MAEEIIRVTRDTPPEKWDYRSIFPRLKRCLSVMYETLRLYTVVSSIKWTSDQSQHIQVGEKTIVLPPNSVIAPSYGSVQTDPKFRGDDSLTWKPERWIKPSAENVKGEDEDLDIPVRGAFIGWSEGFCACPGKKSSQVEFVATMAVLFRHYRVDPVKQESETLDDVRNT